MKEVFKLYTMGFGFLTLVFSFIKYALRKDVIQITHSLFLNIYPSIIFCLILTGLFLIFWQVTKQNKRRG